MENAVYLDNHKRAILGKVWTARILGGIPVGPLKNLDLAEFQPPS